MAQGITRPAPLTCSGVSFTVGANRSLAMVRVGESTWSHWEPRDGDFQFAWMERILDRLH